ncbi:MULTISPECIES: 3-hydroxybutyryl-CoA dehydrogenase [Pseudomonas]|uniref:L-gulonate 3-dehydrogenase n=1 Tax=Pseudomonas monachiensis TaxID=3060212 RepID=A0ABW9HFC8_9PSED|nr:MULTISPECIES: 3-hydroxybutyryl-CoA dehydrogenase [unclassified Pseudomonas]KRB03612.1 3-hydroxybutyryl-CoA dehydrogenase [Pseudomonas sp. Root68]KRB70984.1 3-hydroxybutyryl-CoA dehydrogenase [Pseudomonas sp. Root71]
MNAALPQVSVVGAGRMGEGIALAFIHAGLPVTLIDIKDRAEDERHGYFERVRNNIHSELQMLVRLGVLEGHQADIALARLTLQSRSQAAEVLRQCDLVFEAVPEVIAVKQETFAWVSEHVPASTIIASTTSTFLVTELSEMVSEPQRFVNAHWLNPAYLMPLVEVSRSDATCPQVVQRLLQLLKRIGKVPVVCNPVAGYIVPRIQALVMNEAARMVEEGVASAEDIDTAVRVGFGLRFSVLGLLEFIDWGGGDILYYASRYLSGALSPRFESPQVIADNMQNGRNGLRDGQGFYDYRDMDVDAYKQQRLGDFVRKLELSGLTPAFDGALKQA